MSAVISSTMDSVKALPNKVDTSAVTEPLTKAGRHVHGKASEGIQWYMEQLEDLLHEAEHARTQKFAIEGLTVDGILSELDTAKVSSSIPGRARLRMKTLKRQKLVAEQTAEALKGVPGVNDAVVNPLTGSVLVLFDKAKYSSLDSLLQAVKSQPAEAESSSLEAESTAVEAEAPSAETESRPRKRTAKAKKSQSR